MHIEQSAFVLISTGENTGWFDYSVPLNMCPDTYKPTTLRVAAALGLASRAGISIPEHVRDIVVKLAQKFIFDEDETDLDSPYFACALICFLLINSVDLHN